MNAFAFALGAASLTVATLGVAGAQAEPKDSVTIGMTLEPTSLDPTIAAAAAIGEITHDNIYEGLTKIEADFSLSPQLAEKWTFSPDLKSLTFALRHGVVFQDGEPFTSQDVKFSFERAAAADSTNKEKAFFATIDSIDASDPYAVTLTFKAPSFQALYHLGLNTAVIVDPKSAATNATNPIGTGPYKFVSWNKGASATLEKWDGYRDAAKIAIKRVTFRFISDPSAAMAAMLAGDIDAFPRFPGVQNIAQFQSDPRFQVLLGGSEGKTILSINNKRKPLDDPRVRQALAYAIDRKAIIDGAENGLAQPIGSHLTPNDPGYVDLTGEYPHDPEKAKALLKEAGVTTPLQLTLTLPPPPDYARKGGEIIAAELAEIGVEAKIENVEWAQWLANVFKGKNFDLTIVSHVEPLDIGVYANPDYYFQYDSQAFRDIFARLQAAPDLEAFKAAIGDAQRQIAKDSVNVFLFQYPNVTVADAHLQGLWRNAPVFVNDVAGLSWK
ncbi:MAG: ABC transporter substrate-binding protein [Bradyrhizobium sp.]|nr:MAG: ABC transporter substrate-binding protein [Bradyrhizobium sp.]